MRLGKKWISGLCILLMCTPCFALAAPLETLAPVTLSSPAVMLAEAKTGTVIFEKNADERREVASITKLMTALIVFEALEEGSVTLKDSITVSKNAAAMKGSQALLDADTAYPLEALLKTTIMASANDSAVALAEHLAGSEGAFVEQMNIRAKQLGMENTNYVNCTGYPADGQYTTARDVLRVACEVSKHPDYHQYAKIWIDTLTHPGGRTTDLTNTNRLVRFYEDCDGFKTGSTDAAMYCVCATAEKNGLRLIAVVLGAANSQKRFDEARNLLEYGFSNYKRVDLFKAGGLIGQSVAVQRGSIETVDAAMGSGLSMLLKNGQEKNLKVEVELPEKLQAPVLKGDIIGTVRVRLDHLLIAKLNCVAAFDVPLPGIVEAFYRIFSAWR